MGQDGGVGTMNCAKYEKGEGNVHHRETQRFTEGETETLRETNGRTGGGLEAEDAPVGRGGAGRDSRQDAEAQRQGREEMATTNHANGTKERDGGEGL